MREEILSDEELRDIYRGAKCVVIPPIDSLQPSGQSVCLQAMACGKAVIPTKTSGLWSETFMRYGSTILFVPPGEKDILIEKMKYIINDDDERKRWVRLQ